MHKACRLSLDRVYHWGVLLKEYSPVIECIKDVDNVVSDALSRLEYNSLKNVKNLNSHQCQQIHTKLANCYMINHGGKLNSLSCDADSNDSIFKTLMNNVFANTENEDKIYPVIVSEIAAN